MRHQLACRVRYDGLVLLGRPNVLPQRILEEWWSLTASGRVLRLQPYSAKTAYAHRMRE
jgi:hypothetical protein